MKSLLILCLTFLLITSNLFASDITVGDFKYIIALVITVNLFIAFIVMLLAKFLLQLKFRWWLPFLGSVLGFVLGFIIVELELLTMMPETFFNFAFPLLTALFFIFKFKDSE